MNITQLLLRVLHNKLEADGQLSILGDHAVREYWRGRKEEADLVIGFLIEHIQDLIDEPRKI